MARAYDRRTFLRRSTAAAATGALLTANVPALAVPAKTPSTAPARFRIAHITDAHVHPGRGAPEGLRQCFRHALGNFAPDLVVAGGDQILDALEHPADSVQTYFDCWHNAVKDACPNVPIAYVIGNHDIWGWADPKKSGTTGTEPNYGKAWPLAQFGLGKPYYSMDRGGWRIIVLDSVQFDGSGSYVAQLDEEQFKWLEAELNRTDASMPICIFSHIPIIGFCPLMFDEKSPTTMSRFPKPRWILSRALMHVDARRIKDLFKRHPNVKLCASGHIHLMDKVEYLGVTYVSNPAVSAAWWTGPMQEFENGYGIVDLFADGTFATQTATFGWKVPVG